MSDSTNLQLAYLEAAQAQKHVTVNEVFRRLDAFVQLAVKSATTTAQPGGAADGARYILPAGKTGDDWGTMSNLAIAYYVDGAWMQLTPREGFLAWVEDVAELVIYADGDWHLVWAKP